MLEDTQHASTGTRPDPAAVIQRAWSEVRLAKLQRWVHETI